MKIIQTWDITKDIFQLNPDLKLIFPKLTSKELWAISLYIDPDSKFHNLDNSSKIRIIKQEFYSTFDISLLQESIELYKLLVLTKPKRLLVNWEAKLDERDALINSIPYTTETYEMLDKLMANTPKMWNQYRDILKQFDEEESTTSLGGTQESLAEQGLI